MDSGDTAWMLASTALVMIMLPGLALFYGGLVRRKNVLSTIMHSFFGLALVSVVWVLVGFSLAFGTDVGGFGLIGGLDYVGFANVGLEPSTIYGLTVPFILFAGFQMMFAAITPALITGAFAERKRFGAFVLFTILWSILVYSPIAHWVWSVDGWLFKAGALDFAGGTVVHVSSGVSALIVAILIGRRAINGDKMEPHDVPMTVLGAGLLWFGWFGFNAGSALSAGGLAASAFVVTNTAAAAATITWVLASYLHKGKVSVVGAACGAVAGLVAITPASGFVTAGGALVIGLAAGGLCYSATLLRARVKVDDALDVFAVHGVGGAFGAVATGVFATAAVQEAYSGLIDGNAGQVATQLLAVGATIAYAVVATFVIIKVVDVDPRDPRPVRAGRSRPRHGRPRRGGLSAVMPGGCRPTHPRGPASTFHLGATLCDRSPPTPLGGDRSLNPLRRPVHGHDPSRPTPAPPLARHRRAPVRRAVRARCVRCRVRRGRGWPVARPGAAAGPCRAGGARASRRVRGRWRIERWRGCRAPARPLPPGTPRRRSRGSAARDRLGLPAAWPYGRTTRPAAGRGGLRRGRSDRRPLAGGAVRRDRPGGRGGRLAPRVRAGDRRAADRPPPGIRPPTTRSSGG